MSFLAPWFLAGMLLIGGPIVAHMIRRATRKRVKFSATRFLTQSPPTLDRKNKLQHPWLLAIRCIVILAIAAAFARPYVRYVIPGVTSPELPQNVVAIIDESGSMQRTGVWDNAKAKINALVEGLKPADQFVLLGASGGYDVLVSLDQWKQTAPGSRVALVKTILDSTKPGWGPKHLDAAIEDAIAEWEQMGEKTNETSHKKVVVVSDFTQAARLAGLAGLTWPKGAEVKLESVAPPAVANAGLQWLGWATNGQGDLSARVRVSVGKEGGQQDLSLRLRDARTSKDVGEAIPVKIAPGDAQVVLVPVPRDAADNPLKIVLNGDKEIFDNTLWAVRAPPRELTLGYYGAYDPAAPDALHRARFYLEKAVSAWKDPIVKLRKGDTGADAGAPARADAEVAVLAEPLQPAAIAAMRKRLEAGGFAFVLLTGPEMLDTAAALAGETGWRPAVTARDDALLGEVDFQHPLFALFNDARYSNFANIRFWHPKTLILPEKTAAVVAAKFDDGSPAVVEVPVGKGGIVVWGGNWEPDSSQWVLSSKFVPFLQAFFERAAGGALRPNLANVGDAKLITGTEPTKWRTLATADAAFQDKPFEEPGVYQIDQGGMLRSVALEVPPELSNLAPLPMEAWEKLGVPLHAEAVTSATPLSPALGNDQTAATIESHQQLWRWLMVATAILLAVESLYSLALARRAAHTNTSEPATS